MGLIGVIDSGIGGITILQKLRQNYAYDFVYLADHAFCPYGTKSNDVLYSRADKLVSYLESRGAQAVVLACNTLSCFASRLSKAHQLPIFGVIEPTCKRLVCSGVRRVALLATRSTIANGAYQSTLAQFGIQTVTFDCSAFVPYVEQRATTTLACQRAVDEALRNLPQMQVDAVILGCTHFPLLRSVIAYYCEGAQIVECSCDLPTNIPSASSLSQNVSYLTTGNVDFANTAASCFKLDVRFVHLQLP